MIGSLDTKMLNDDKLAIVYESLYFNSAQLSNIARFVNFGLLGVVWSAIVSDTDIFTLKPTTGCGLEVADVLLLSLGLVLLALVIDFGQYIFGYIRDIKAKRKIEASNTKVVKAYDTKCRWRLASRVCFWLKLSITALNLSMIAYLLYSSVLTHVPRP
jgi:hypothetical protein